ncbi:hypothetical protein E9228_002794 [Curtobacterium flaccumfaciens]|uniref:Uncharacterized protein n=1 Tax=Curtobacterium salicis TaxID=1779862 RepID=A0ABX0T9D6_9MICO|nr:hypothetical protein [Curtobacterium sp. WW7]NII42136.1 hypothetical protein [Curtobacterium sp. WW7]
MTTSTLPQSTDTSKDIVAKYGTDVLELAMTWVNSGVRHHTSIPPIIGDRYVMVLRQEPHNDRFPDRLTADRINPDQLDHLGLHPESGHQWGYDDEDDPGRFMFTVVGTYILDGIKPDTATLTFTATFHREPQEATA